MMTCIHFDVEQIGISTCTKLHRNGFFATFFQMPSTCELGIAPSTSVPQLGSISGPSIVCGLIEFVVGSLLAAVFNLEICQSGSYVPHVISSWVILKMAWVKV